MDLVTDYSVGTDNDTQFDVSFKIPVNCTYTNVVSGKYYNITVQLQPGQTVPSTTFATVKLSLAVIDTVMYISFYQVSSAKTAIKPRIKIETC